jgi:hypothetical protein
VWCPHRIRVCSGTARSAMASHSHHGGGHCGRASAGLLAWQAGRQLQVTGVVCVLRLSMAGATVGVLDADSW